MVKSPSGNSLSSSCVHCSFSLVLKLCESLLNTWVVMLAFRKKKACAIRWSIWWTLDSLVDYECVVQELLNRAVAWTILPYCLKFAYVKTTDYSDLFSTDPIIADQIISYLMEFCWNLREKQSWKVLSIDLSNNNHATDESTYFALCYC